MSAADASGRRARMFAAKWRAEENTETPTDDALEAAFRSCVKPPGSDLYPTIRDEIARAPIAGHTGV